MARRKSEEQRLRELEEKEQQLKARRKQQQQIVRAKERKRDTRRKIIVGANLIDLADRDPLARDMLEHIVTSLNRARDRAVFDNWQLPGTDMAEERDETEPDA